MERAGSGDVAVAILAQELAEQYRRMSRSQRTLHNRALLRVTAEILEILAQEALNGLVLRDTVDRLEIISRHLRRNGLPHYRVDSLVRLIRRLYLTRANGFDYGVPQVDVSNTILS